MVMEYTNLSAEGEPKSVYAQPGMTKYLPSEKTSYDKTVSNGKGFQAK